MAYLQSSCVVGTLAIMANHACAQDSIYIMGSDNNPEYSGNCNLIAIGKNTTLTGSGGLNPATLTLSQDGENFTVPYSYYQIGAEGCSKPTTLTGGGGGTGATVIANPVRYTNYYQCTTFGEITSNNIFLSDPGTGYTSTVSGFVSDPCTTAETCALFTIEPLNNENSINIGHSAGCRSQGQNTIRIGSCAGKGNLNNGYCFHVNSIAIGTNNMLSGSFTDSIAIGENALKGNTTCTNFYKEIIGNVVIGKNSFCNFSFIAKCNTIVGNCNIPEACGGLLNTIIGYGNGQCVTGTAGACNIIIGEDNAKLSGTYKGIGTRNIMIGSDNFACSARGTNNVVVGSSNMDMGIQINTNYNMAVGLGNLRKLTTGDFNVGIGTYTGYCNTTGFENVYIGCSAGRFNCTGVRSIYMGSRAGCGMGNQTDSIFIGGYSGEYGRNTQGGHVVIGYKALYNSSNGYFNTAIGYCALTVGGQTSTSCAISGGCNIAIGSYAGQCIKLNSNNNIYIGHQSGPTTLTAETYKFYLGQGGGSPLMCGCLLSSAKSLCINGTLSKTAGSFAISHPNPTKTQACELWHSFVESPTAGDNLYRFEVKVENGQVTMDLPDYYKHLNEDDQVWVNAKNHFGRAYGVLNQEQTTLTVFADTDGEYNILLMGTRKDKDAVNAWKGIERKKQN